MRKIEFNGVVYKSLTECAKVSGVRRDVLSWRLRHGFSNAELFFKGNLKNVKSVDHLGNEFETIRAMVKHWDISPQLFYIRLARGWDLKKTLTYNRGNK